MTVGDFFLNSFVVEILEYLMLSDFKINNTIKY